MEQCFFLGFEFPGGTCAQWFSGSASALAVAVAVSAHFYSAWRQRKADERDEAAEIAGISMLLRGIIDDAATNASMFFGNFRIINLWGEKYVIGRRLGAVRAAQVSGLEKGQADVLLRSDQVKLAENIDMLVRRANLNNLGIEDYSSMREELNELVLKHSAKLADIGNHVTPSSDDGKIIAAKMFSVSAATENFIRRTEELLRMSIKAADDFNVFCSGNTNFTKYLIDVGGPAGLLRRMEKAAEAQGSAK